MSRIRAVRNDGKEYSKAEGSFKTILKMISSLPESESRQIIISRKELDSFVTKNNFMSSTLYKVKVFYCMKQEKFAGRVKKTIGNGYDSDFELEYVEIPKVDHYILTRARVDGKVVYIAPQAIDINDGLMELSI